MSPQVSAPGSQPPAPHDTAPVDQWIVWERKAETLLQEETDAEGRGGHGGSSKTDAGGGDSAGEEPEAAYVRVWAYCDTDSHQEFDMLCSPATASAIVVCVVLYDLHLACIACGFVIVGLGKALGAKWLFRGLGSLLPLKPSPIGSAKLGRSF